MSCCKSKINELISEYEKFKQEKLNSNVFKGIFPWIASGRNSTDPFGNYLL